VNPECKCRKVGPPSTNLGVRGFGELTISMAECEGLALATLAKMTKSGELARVATRYLTLEYEFHKNLTSSQELISTIPLQLFQKCSLCIESERISKEMRSKKMVGGAFL
jgi:hypothetical protein